jgi:23S rRNA (uracil1939-C5)-methyltransferase
MQKLKVNDIIELEISGLGYEGNGIGRINDFVIFVKYTVPGDKVRTTVKKVKKNYAEGIISEILSPSSLRADPQCEHFGACNGCKMQNITYDYQLRVKRQNVKNALEKIGESSGIEIPEVLGSDDIYYYRNKLEFSFSNNKWLTESDYDSEANDKSFALGFHMPGFTDKVLDIKKCYLQSENSNKTLHLTRDFFKSKKATIYTTKTHTGYLRFLVIRQSANTNDLMVNIVTSTEDRPLINEYSRVIQEQIPEVTTLLNTISTTKAQVVKGDYSITIYGKGYIEEKLGDHFFKITPNSFFQTNSRQAQKLFDTVTNFGEFTGNENVLDLYCGTGAISISISNKVKSVKGVELSDESISTAIENAIMNNITNCEFISYDVKDYLSYIIPEADKNIFDTVIIDPPRSGLHPKAAEYLLKLEPKKIIYVSCNPSTQARDVKLLSEKYYITKIQPVDMFPHTFHIENVVRLDRKESIH